MEYYLKNEKDLDILADEIVKLDSRIIFLIGDLGSGKTTLTKYLAKKLHIDDEVSSPTFILHNEYISIDKKNKLHHIDLYRLESENELAELKLDKLDQNDFIVIEWADKFEDYLNNILKNCNVVRIYIENISSNARIMTINTI